ncbi:formylglycine-generating enzyme family protein [bacterium]|nr:MAG: formylglycine-generating enzyme family protein [bacterium]
MKRTFALIIAAIAVLAFFPAERVYAKDTDYNSLTGEPKCSGCHTPDKRYSIDYTRDATCAECHGPGLSDKYLDINASHRSSADASDDVMKNFVKFTDARVDVAKAPSEEAVTYTAKKRRSPKKPMQELKTMVAVPGGEFTMGANDWWPKSQPEHKRKLPAFQIDKYEVANIRYKAFLDATGRGAPDHWPGGKIPEAREDHPVVFVTWSEADAFCKWEGKRLPTEAEWEKAARGAGKRIFPWGDKFSKYNANTPQLGLEDTMPVGSFDEGKSPYGVYDMAGNVWEWTADWFKPYPGNTHPDENYGDKFKVLRGGSWYDCTYYKCGISSPAYNKIFFNPQTKNNNFGFRCAK